MAYIATKVVEGQSLRKSLICRAGANFSMPIAAESVSQFCPKLNVHINIGENPIGHYFPTIQTQNNCGDAGIMYTSRDLS